MIHVNYNIPKLYLLYAFQSMSFCSGLIIPFVIANHVTLDEFFLLQSLYSLAVFILEVPSGYASDIWGRKPTIMISGLAGTAGSFLYALGTNFWHFLVAELLLAILWSFQSGTLDALTYETHQELKLSNSHYDYVTHRQKFLNFLFQAIGSFMGGIVAYFFGLRVALLCTAVSYSFVPLITWSLVEPARHTQKEAQAIKDIWRVCYQTFRFNVPLRSIIMLSSALGTMTMGLVWLGQAYQDEIHLPVHWYGFSNTAILSATAFAVWCLPKLKQRLDDRKLLMGISAVILLSYFAIGQTLSVFGLLFFLLGRAMWGALSALKVTMMQPLIPSHRRATVLSFESLLGRLIFAAASLFMGALAQSGGVSITATVIATIGTIIVVSIFLAMRPIWRQLPS